MNTLVSYSTTSPYGKEDVCAKFVITDASIPFVLNKIATPGQNYAFSCWLKSDSEGSIIVGDTSFACSSESWTKVCVKFTASSEDVSILFGVVGTYYIYRAQLEIGSMVTDWTPAPEDVNDSITDVSTKIDILSDEISMEFKTTNETIQTTKDGFDTKFEQFYKHISFSENGIIISNGENTLTLTLDNDGIIFSKNGVPFGSWDGVDFYTGNIVVRVEERAQFGNFAFVPRSDGSLSFLKVGG
jgi:hypothetical protein